MLLLILLMIILLIHSDVNKTGQIGNDSEGCWNNGTIKTSR